MATNPMQRKARNSFLLGMFITLVISGAVIAVLVLQLMNKSKKEADEKGESVSVYVLKQDVNSGQVITTDMLDKVSTNKKLVPSNATSDMSVFDNFALQDKEGNNISTVYENGKNPKLYVNKDNNNYEIKTEEDTGNYYIEKGSQKEYIELNSVPMIAKVEMKKGTVMTTDLLSKSDNKVLDDVRKQEYNMLVLPMDLETGDYIDVRVMFPSGQDYIVVAKKEVEIPNINGTDSEDTIWVNLSEDEILHMSCAIIDAYKVPGSKLYVTKYTEPGIQKAATPTYVMDQTTANLLSNDENILNIAMTGIKNRYNSVKSQERRNEINSMINEQGDQANTNIQTNMEESITNSQNSRKEYLESLSGAVSK